MFDKNTFDFKGNFEIMDCLPDSGGVFWKLKKVYIAIANVRG